MLREKVKQGHMGCPGQLQLRLLPSLPLQATRCRKRHSLCGACTPARLWAAQRLAPLSLHRFQVSACAGPGMTWACL